MRLFLSREAKQIMSELLTHDFKQWSDEIETELRDDKVGKVIIGETRIKSRDGHCLKYSFVEPTPFALEEITKMGRPLFPLQISLSIRIQLL